MIPGVELEAMRGVLAGTYADTVEVLRLARVRTRTGATRDEYLTVLRAPCRVAPGFIPTAERRIVEGVQSVAEVIVYLAPGPDVRPADRLRLETTATTGRLQPDELEVTGTDMTRSGAYLEQRIRCLEVGPGGPPPPGAATSPGAV